MPGAQWHEVRGGVVLFSSPVEVTPTGGTGADTAFAEWQGDGLVVRADYGLFVDPLTGHRSRAGTQLSEETIDGRAARVLAADQPDGSRFTAAHFPDLSGPDGRSAKLTFVVITSGQRTAEEALEIIRSLRFTR